MSDNAVCLGSLSPNGVLCTCVNSNGFMTIVYNAIHVFHAWMMALGHVVH